MFFVSSFLLQAFFLQAEPNVLVNMFRMFRRRQKQGAPEGLGDITKG